MGVGLEMPAEVLGQTEPGESFRLVLCAFCLPSQARKSSLALLDSPAHAEASDVPIFNGSISDLKGLPISPATLAVLG